MPPALTVTIGRFARGDTACSACATRLLPVPFSPVIRPDPRHHLEHRPHRRRLGQDRRVAIGLQCLIGRFELMPSPEGAPQFRLRADDREQPIVVPGLLDEVARPAAHRFDGNVHRAPCRHHDDGQGLVGGVDALQQFKALLSRRGVPGVVEVHQEDVEVLHLECAQELLRRGCGIDRIAVRLQQQPQRLEDVRLIVGEQQARGRLSSHRGPSHP
jgi:hypothetical protein